MKVSLSLDKKTDRLGYWRIYYYAPQPAGRAKKVSLARFKADLDNLEPSRKDAEKKRKRFERDLELHGGTRPLTAGDRLDYDRARNKLPLDVSIEQAIDCYLAYIGDRQHLADISIHQAIEAFMSTRRRRGLRPRSIEFYETIFNVFALSWGSRSVHTIGREELVNWILSLQVSPLRMWAYFNAIKGLLEHGLGREPAWLTANPLDKAAADRMPLVRQTPPGILDVDASHRFLQALEDEPKFAGLFAIRYFTGLRVSTLQATDWRQIDPDRKLITITPEADKKGRERFLEGMPDQLWPWIERYGHDQGPISRVRSAHIHQVQRRIAARANIDSRPANWMRHNFASYHIHRGLDLTLMIMCHEGTGSTFWNKYFRRTTKAEGNRYFQIAPDPVGA